METNGKLQTRVGGNVLFHIKDFRTHFPCLLFFPSGGRDLTQSSARGFQETRMWSVRMKGLEFLEKDFRMLYASNVYIMSAYVHSFSFFICHEFYFTQLEMMYKFK